jgi:hypothetical protein
MLDCLPWVRLETPRSVGPKQLNERGATAGEYAVPDYLPAMTTEVNRCTTATGATLCSPPVEVYLSGPPH